MKSLVFLIALPVLLFLSIELVQSQTYNGSNDSIYDSVDQKPYLKGKKNKLNNEIKKHLNYPLEYKVAGIEGVVFVECIINTNGEINGCHIEKPVEPVLDEEAMKAVLNLGPWIPGKVSGSDVITRLTIPVAFQLDDSEKAMYSSLKAIDFKNKPPLFILDGKMVEELIHLEYYNVQSIRVVKGPTAIDKYGEAAMYGVVEVTTKRGTPRHY